MMLDDRQPAAQPGGSGGNGTAAHAAAAQALKLREQLVDLLRRTGAITTEPVADAFLRVPRERFLPGVPVEAVYQDEAILTKEIGGEPVSSSSQPAIMAIMLEQLDLEPGMNVLEIGAGTGYNAALLRELVGDRGRVTTVDIDAEVAGWARDRLDSAGYRDVNVVRADGAFGYPAAAPYDRIILTVGTADIAPAWIEQLRDQGRIVLPIWLRTSQVSAALEKHGSMLESVSLRPCGFMSIRGSLAGGDQFVRFRDGVYVSGRQSPEALDRLGRLLALDPRHESWPEGDLWNFPLFAALWDEAVLTISANSEQATGFAGRYTGYLAPDDESLCLVHLWLPKSSGRQEVQSLIYGSDTARDRLRDIYRRWRSIGSP
ncbi:MAG TPA: methyltransferase domain-containing protein, partial [Thermomicrobiaceae bacterium]|nr:methyltransferase domain-containing protein [Thermomicrobiaceae bacterium]